MGPTLPPIDRYAHRRESQRNATEMFREFGNKLQEKHEKEEENAYYKEKGLELKGLRPEARKMALQEYYKDTERKKTSEDEGNLISNFAYDKENKKEFNFNEPETWTDKQVDKFRALEGKTQKSKTLSNMGKNEYEKRLEVKKQSKKQAEEISPLEGALESIEKMKSLRKKGNLGVFSPLSGIFSKETRKDSGEYQQLGKSLISYASKIPIRNQSEFNTMAEDLFDPTITDAKAEGILTAMEKIIRDSLRTAQGMEGQQEMNQPLQQAERPPLTSFFR